MQERVIAGVVLGLMGFVIAWLMNRRARLLQREEYCIVDVVERAGWGLPEDIGKN